MTLSSLKDITGNIYAIERMGMFDGPGVRFVLFLQGCPFKCKYCHNRDSWSTEQNMTMTVSEVYDTFKKYASFYKRGGLTISGGEPLLQLPFITALTKYFKAHGVHVTLDTSGGLFTLASKEKYNQLLDNVDLVLLDIKHIDEEEHKELVGISNKNILAFTTYLSERKVPIYLRHVLVPGISDKKEHLQGLRAFLDTLSNIVKIEILPYHTRGVLKWEKLGLKYPLVGVREPSKEEIQIAESILIKDYRFSSLL